MCVCMYIRYGKACMDVLQGAFVPLLLLGGGQARLCAVLCFSGIHKTARDQKPPGLLLLLLRPGDKGRLASLSFFPAPASRVPFLAQAPVRWLPHELQAAAAAVLCIE